MKQGFYFFFYKIIHNEAISVIFANVAYFLYCCKYAIKKLLTKKEIVTMDKNTASKKINEVYPKPICTPDYSKKQVDSNTDLSIIVPVYNYKKVFEKSAKTVVNQKTKYNYEVIFVDDGSTDGVDEILKYYENNPNVRVIFQKNMGIGGARNTGLCNATGKYLMFMDCDDEVHENIVEILMDKALETDSDIVMGAHNLVKEKNGIVLDVTPNIYPKYNLMRYKNNKQDFFMNYPGLPWCKIYKRELFDKVRFFPGYWYEDNIIHGLIFTSAESFVFVPEVLYEYKWYESNFSHIQGKTKNIKCLDCYWIITEIIKRYKEININSDVAFYGVLLRELGQYCYGTISELDEDIIKSVFVLACEIIKENRPKEKYKLPFMKKQVEKAFLNKDYALWKLVSKYQ